MCSVRQESRSSTGPPSTGKSRYDTTEATIVDWRGPWGVGGAEVGIETCFMEGDV